MLDSDRVSTVGGEVFANYTCDYGGLFSTVTEIRTEPDQCTKQGAPDICCISQSPESRATVEDIQERLSARFRYPKQLEDLGLNRVVLTPSIPEPLSERMLTKDGRLLSLTYFCDSDYGCNAQVLALSNDIGFVLCKVRGDPDTYEIPIVLSYVERLIGGYRFSYEARDTGVESLYLSYAISGTPVLLQQPAGHA